MGMSHEPNQLVEVGIHRKELSQNAGEDENFSSLPHPKRGL